MAKSAFNDTNGAQTHIVINRSDCSTYMCGCKQYWFKQPLAAVIVNGVSTGIVAWRQQKPRIRSSPKALVDKGTQPQLGGEGADFLAWNQCCTLYCMYICTSWYKAGKDPLFFTIQNSNDLLTQLIQFWYTHTLHHKWPNLVHHSFFDWKSTALPCCVLI